MFWECHVVTSSIEKLLDQPRDEIKLQDFLDETDLIQECLNQNQRLLDYLVQKDIMHELIHHLITYPIDDNFRYANVVSELLSGDFQRIQESLLDKENLDLLYSFLTKNERTLNPILASYFAKIINTLIIRKTNELVQYFRQRQTFEEDFFRHADTTSITDILYRLVADSNEQRSEVIKWYEERNLIDGLIHQFLRAESPSAQMNIANLLSEFLRLAFDQPTGIDCDFAGPTLSATIERLLHNRTETTEGSSTFNRLSSNSDDEKRSIPSDTENKLTPIILAEHILSKSNLEQIFDTVITRPIFVCHGCELLDTVFDLLTRHMSVPICIPMTSNRTENEQMQINDESDTSIEKKFNELTNLAKEPLVRIYLTLLEIIPSRLPSLIALLSSPSPPLIPSTENNSKHQFITEPLGSMRLNLIKFFSKLLHTISNDYTGDHLYDIFKSNRLFPILIDLFLRHIYNNFLHTQIHLIIRLLIHNNSLAVKQPNDIWTRTNLPDGNTDNSSSSSFHYTHRCSYKLFQNLFNPTEGNLFERLLDQYELNVASMKCNSTSDETTTSVRPHTRFASPNSGHIAQILRCLRDHAAIFDNYSAFFKAIDQEQIDDQTNVLEIRWQTALDYLTEDEKKCSAMHHTERTSSHFRLNASTTNYLIQTNPEYSDASQRRHNFHLRSFVNATRPYVDDEEDDDEIERFDIDDELMKNDQNSNERKVSEMKKISFEPEFKGTFDEQTLWYEQDQTNKDDEKLNSAPTLPDLFENHRNQQEKNCSSSTTTESNFEQLCSLRANDPGSTLFPFQSSSTIRDEAISKNDHFWQKHPIYLVNSTENQQMDQSSSSDDDDDEHTIDDDDEDQSKIPDDEKFFVETDENLQSNNMMDIFRRQSPNSTEEKTSKDTILSSTPERPTNISFEDHSNQLDLVEQGIQYNGAMNNNDGDEDSTLEDNFSFLIAKGMLKPA